MIRPRPAFRTAVSGLFVLMSLMAALPAAAESVGRWAAPGGAKIAAGAAHNLRIAPDGTVWSWGTNAEGTLGDGTTIQRSYPVGVAGLAGVVAVAAGKSHSLAVRSDGTVWEWGCASACQSYQGGGTLRPVVVSGLTGVVSVAAGQNFSLALKSDGSVWSWGNNGWGQLGDASVNRRSFAAQIAGLSDVVAVAAGAKFSLAIKGDGTVWSWGQNDSGQLGDGTHTSRATPQAVAGISDVSKVAAGVVHAVALKRDGSVWAWGMNSTGVLGDGTTDEQTHPVQVVGLTNTVAIATGVAHSLAVRADGTVWAWGWNDRGTLGDGTTNCRRLAAPVSGLSGAESVAAGDYYSLVLLQDGSMRAFGDDYFGQLGNGAILYRSVPVAVPAFTGVVAASMGSSHCLAVRNDGTVWAWGDNGAGQLGDSSGGYRSSPAQVPGGVTGAARVAVGDTSSYVVKNDGTLVSISDGLVWGLPGLNDVRNLSSFYRHVLLTKSDGAVWAWGDNISGQVGVGTMSSTEPPTWISSIPEAISVAAGTGHSLAAQRDGTVKAWGANNGGQLGTGVRVDRYSPVLVPGLTGITQVAAGYWLSLAVKNDGTVWAWGTMYMSQSDVWTLVMVPSQVAGLSDVVAVAAGANSSYALKSNGTVWAWGNNQYGQLGDGTLTDHSTPVQVVGLSDITAISAAWYGALAVKRDGSLWVWGWDTMGRLGVGTQPWVLTTQPTLPLNPSAAFSRSKLAFGALTGSAAATPAQEVLLTQSAGGGAAWTAVAGSPWLTVSPVSGTGNARLSISLNRAALPAAGNYSTVVSIISGGLGNSPLQLPVTLQVSAAGTPPYGSFDTPSDFASGLAAAIPVTGWVLDAVGVASVKIWRDPVAPEPAGGLVYIGDAIFVPGARSDVEVGNPNTPQAYRAGWGYMMLTNFLPGNGNGVYKLYAIATNLAGQSATIGTKTISVDNAHAVKPFGSIATPAQGATVSGASYNNAGWALTPPPSKIPTDGSTIRVFIDGQMLGTLDYNHPRSDIAALFPGYLNSAAGSGFRSIDTTRYSDGMHTIAWSVRDDQGRVDGVGSRYFNILNGVPAGAAQPAEAREAVAVQAGAVAAGRRERAQYRTGYGEPMAEALPGELTVEPLERLEIELGEGPWSGAVEVGGDVRPLPVGSQLDARSGAFTWQLGPGFLGPHQLRFESGSRVVRLKVNVGAVEEWQVSAPEHR